MRKKGMKRFIFLSLMIFAAFSLSGCDYNTLTAKQQNVRGKWSNVESQLQRRSDLIPNAFEAAKAAGVQEQEVFGQISQARSQLLNAVQAAPQGTDGDKTPEQKQAVIAANNSFGGTIGRLLSLQENYPQLRSNELFLNFQNELTGTENRIGVARQDYNTAVQDYNTGIKQFPGVLTASIFGFKEEPYFQAEEGARQAPRINSNDLRRNNAPGSPAQQTAPAQQR
jgi:LemA protein